MDSAFSQAVAGWHDFYMLLGGAAATLLGLLFVAVSLHTSQFTAGGDPALRMLALQTYANFLYLLLLALAFLQPEQNPGILAGLILFASIFALTVHLVELLGPRQ